MTYLLLQLAHLLAAVAFIGTWFAQLAVLRRARRGLDETAQGQLEAGWSAQSRRVLHGVVVLLYGAGLGLLWHYRAVLADPLASRFALLLSLKITLALTLVLSFALVALLARRGALSPGRRQLLEWMVLAQMLAIVVLAKLMFYAG